MARRQMMTRLGRAVRWARRAWREPLAPPLRELRSLDALDDDDFIVGAYLYLLECGPDSDGLENWRHHLAAGTRSRRAMLAEMRALDDFWERAAMTYVNPLHALHRSRCLFVRSLPRAAHILDLGGTHQQSREGALVKLGYPYPFERLVVVDLPVGERHALYQEMPEVERADTRLGQVEYHYRSMVDLSPFPADSFDLVYSGQSIEHVTRAEADEVLHQAWRVLRPGGWLALDTPNGRACRLQLRGTGLAVTNPDHEVEYDHAELVAKVEAAGYEVLEQKGLCHVPRSFVDDDFSEEELAASTGVYADIETCYLLAYVCRKPVPGSRVGGAT